MFLAAGNKSAVRFSSFVVAAVFTLMIVSHRGAATSRGPRMLLPATVDHEHPRGDDTDDIIQERENLFGKYFNGISIAPAQAAISTGDDRVGQGLEDSFRRVPSCPDPLHN